MRHEQYQQLMEDIALTVHERHAGQARDPGEGGACDRGRSREATRGGVKPAARPATALRPSTFPENHRGVSSIFFYR